MNLWKRTLGKRLDWRFQPSILAVLGLCALAAATPCQALEASFPIPRTAWDAVVETSPTAHLEAFSPLERRILDSLSPAEGLAYLEGDGSAPSMDEVLSTSPPLMSTGRGREMIFVPVEPCALADTRVVGGPFGHDEIRFFVVRGETTDYSPQGGSSGGCGIPGLSEALTLSNTARAVLLHFEVLAASRDGKLTSWAANLPQPTQTHLSYRRAPFAPGPPALGTSGMAIVPLCDAEGVDPCPFGDIRLRLSGGAHLAIAVHGYFLSDQAVPPGLISMWSGALAEIPTGWALCDGTDGTPDLRDRFVLGAGEGEEPGAVGGAHSFSLSEDQLAPHGHDLTLDAAGSHSHGYLRPRLQAASVSNFVGAHTPWSLYDPAEGASTSPAGHHAHSGTALSTGLGSPIDNRPAFFELAFIIKK